MWPELAHGAFACIKNPSENVAPTQFLKKEKFIGRRNQLPCADPEFEITVQPYEVVLGFLSFLMGGSNIWEQFSRMRQPASPLTSRGRRGRRRRRGKGIYAAQEAWIPAYAGMTPRTPSIG